jgi:hypothetical protein
VLNQRRRKEQKSNRKVNWTSTVQWNQETVNEVELIKSLQEREEG